MSDVVTVTIAIDRGIHAGIAARAAAMNCEPKAYIRRLIDAAYAARVGRERQLPVGDLEMDDAVRAVFCLAGEFDVKRIARATGYSEEFCDNVLRGWKQARGAPSPPPSTPPQPAPPPAPDKAGYPVEQIREWWAQGMTGREIDARIGKSTKAFEMWAGKHRDVCPKRINP